MALSYFSFVVACIFLASAVTGDRSSTEYPNNLGCSSLGSFAEFKIDSPTSGNFSIPELGGHITLGSVDDNSVGSWTSNFQVTAIIVNGENAAVAHRYDPQVDRDAEKLHAPWDGKTGTYHRIKRMCVCYDLKVLICDVASGSFDSKFVWDITKDTENHSIIVPLGTPLETVYTYTAKSTQTKTNYTLYGSILIRNPYTLRPIFVDVSATFGTQQLTLECPTSVTSHLKIEAGKSVTCEYKKQFASAPDMFTPVNVVVTVPGDKVVGGAYDQVLPFWRGNMIDECIDLTDSIVGHLAVKCHGWDSCDDEFHHPIDTSHCGLQTFVNQITGVTIDTNTTYKSNNVTVQVEVPCNLNPSCDVAGNNDLRFTWNVSKTTSNHSSVIIPPDSTGVLLYQYTLVPTSTREQFILSGSITICNPNKLYAVPIQSVVVTYGSVTLSVSWSIPPQPSVTIPVTLPVSACLVGSFIKEIPEQPNNTQLLVNVQVGAQSMVPGVSQLCGPFTWAIDDKIDACVLLNDTLTFVGKSQTSDLGTKCSGVTSIPVTQTISTVGVPCGPHDAINTIYATGIDSGTIFPSNNVPVEVVVPCTVDVTLQLSGMYDLAYQWQIEKNTSTPNLSLPPNGEQNVTYYYTLTPSAAPTNWTVSGQVQVNNTRTMQSVTFSVTVTFASQTVTATCGKHALLPGEATTCTFVMHFSAMPPDNAVATANVVATPAYLSASATATLGTFPSNWVIHDKIDECVGIADHINGISLILLPGQCVGDPAKPITRSFVSLITKCQCDCDDYVVRDYLSATAVDSHTTVTSNNVTVSVDVVCNDGCTLGQTYWRDHSSAPNFNSRWNKYLGQLFGVSGQDYVAVMVADPSGANKYYALAHQYIAARLNIDNGVVVKLQNVVDALNYSTLFFSTYTPANWPSTETTNLTNAITVLTAWNEGITGPGLC